MGAISRQLGKNAQYRAHGPGLPRALSVRSKFVAVGTSRGLTLVFDHFQEVRDARAGGEEPVWKSTTGLGRPHQTSELSISVKSKSIRLIFGRIDCSRRVLEAQPKSLRQNCRICAH